MTDDRAELSADARRQARAMVRRSGTSFGPGMAILPRPRRDAMHAVYAFCRAVDDIADDDAISQQERIDGLSAWRMEVDRLFDDQPATPIGIALQAPVRQFALPKSEFLMMIEGMEMDARGPIIAPTMDELLAYTRRVAGAVGLLSMPIFGAPKGERSDRFALALGDALQLTNILRDVGEDAGLGRIYLPAELLERHAVLADPGRILGAPGLPGVAEALGALAGQRFVAARRALNDLDWRTVRPALLMMGVYEAYLKRLALRGWDRVGEGMSLPSAWKLMIAVRYAVAPPLRKAP